MLIIASCAFVVIHGVNVGIKEFSPLKGIPLGLDLTGGVYIVYEAADPTVDDLDTKIEGAMSIFRQRLDDKGFTEATITKQGSDRIRVEVPINDKSEIKDPSEIVNFIGTPAHLEFQDKDGKTVVQGEDLISAKAAQTETGEYVVSFEMNDTAAKAFAKATQEAYSDNKAAISIVLDGKTISSPSVNSVIPNGKGEIEGNFTLEQAKNLATQIESGALPLDLKSIEERSISSTLGDDALQKAIFGGIIGFIILIIFMIAVYRLPGLAADIALVAYTIIVLFLISLFQIQLTLPGIAGIILGIGMAVDANVVIFARFKEEYRTGKSLRAALKTGFSKAATAITDSNATTMIAAIVLAMFGTGSIKGFAYTLALSIVVSLISALLITQGLMKLVLGLFPNRVGLYMPLHKKKQAEVKEGGAE